MRHKKQGRKLNRNKSSRLALFRSMLLGLFRYGKIMTTCAKAKECAPKADRVITLAKRADRKITEAETKSKASKNGEMTPELQQQIDKSKIAIQVNYLRQIVALIQDKELAHNIFYTLAPLFKNRQGGYTSVVRFEKHRDGDNAPQALLRLVEFPKTDDKTEEKADAKPKVKKDKQGIKAKQKKRKERQKELAQLKKEKEQKKQQEAQEKK